MVERSNGVKPEHPEVQQLLDVLLHPVEFVYFHPKDGREIEEEVHEHLAECDPCVRVVQENIKFY